MPFCQGLHGLRRWQSHAGRRRTSRAGPGEGERGGCPKVKPVLLPANGSAGRWCRQPSLADVAARPEEERTRHKQEAWGILSRQGHHCSAPWPRGCVWALGSKGAELHGGCVAVWPARQPEVQEKTAAENPGRCGHSHRQRLRPWLRVGS